MDHKIYGQLNRPDLGVYATRRYPKGVNVPVSVPQGPTQPTDPNANPYPIDCRYAAANVAAHADIERWRYEVPPRRRAVIQNAEVEYARSVAGAGNQQIFSQIVLTRKGRATRTELIRVTSHDDPISLGLRAVLGAPVEMFEGDVLISITTIGSGNAHLLSSLFGIEYDATHRVIQTGAESGQNAAQFNTQTEPNGGTTGGGSGVWPLRRWGT